MASGVESLPTGIADGLGVPASAAVSINLRVLTQTGPIGLLTDVVTFTGVPTVAGNWVVGTLRTQIMNIPMINQDSAGIGYSAVGVPTGTMTVTIADQKVLAT